MEIKKIFSYCFIVCMLLFSHASFSQSCIWARNTTASTGSFGNSVTKDNVGNVYVTGALSTGGGGTAAFGNGVSLTSMPYNAFIAKYDPAGNCLWAKGISASSGSSGNGIAFNGSNIYVTGEFSTGAGGSASFGNSISLTSSSASNAFIAKYDLSGTCLWARAVQTSSGSKGNGVALDASSVYITGQFSTGGGGNASFGNSITLTSSPSNTFTAKYDLSGNCLWAKAVQTSSGSGGNGIAVDASSNVYITGQFSTGGGGNAAFGNSITLTSSASNTFIAKYNLSGTCLWAKAVQASTGSAGNGIALDASSNVYITGQFSTGGGGSAAFGNSVSLTSNAFNTFTAKYDLSGNCQWAKAVQASTGGKGNGIAVDASKVYITGQLSTGGGGSAIFGNGISLTTMPYNAFIATYDLSGNCTWARAVQTSSGSEGKAITVTDCAQFYATGSFSTGGGGTAAFGNGVTLTFSPTQMFLSKYSYTNPILTRSGNGYIYPGSTGSFTYTVTNPSNMPLTYQWQYSPDGINWFAVPNAAPYSGVNTPSLTITNAPASIAGYTYRLVVTGVCFTTTTPPVTVCPLSNVSLTTFNNVCITDPAFTLSGGSPAGGTYYIYKNNVPTNTPSTTFDPLALGIGTHTIVYVYTYASGCSYSASQTITVGNPSINTTSAIACNAAVPVPFTVSCAFFPGNVFKAQLSKPDGTFDPSPYTIGTLTGTTAGTINGTLPSPLAPGTYKIRVVSTNPSVVGIETTLVLNGNCRTGNGITDNTGYSNDVNVYPNPASEHAKLEIMYQTILKVELMDMNGKNIQTLKAEPLQEIDLTALPDGLYIIKIQTSEGITYKKLEVN